MKYPKKELFSQVKSYHLSHTNGMKMFEMFKLSRVLKNSGIHKDKGYKIIEIIYQILVFILERSSSVNAGLKQSSREKLKSPLNNMLNNQWYNWRKLLYKIASIFIKKYPVKEGKDAVLIIDDTSKVKTGRHGQNISWFVDHCKKVYYMGFQVVMSAYSNGRTTIPIDFENKIGKKRINRSSRTNYHKKSHAKQRERMAKQSKLDIAIQFINRAMQRRYRFSFVLWDSWYVSGKTMSYVKTRLIPKGINLIAMAKQDQQRYLFNGKYLTIKKIFRQAGRWNKDKSTGVKYKSAMVKILDKTSSRKPEKRRPLIEVRMCFFKYPKQKKFRVVISSDTEKSELEVLELYLRRWSIEVIFKELKQYFGYDQSKSSNYFPQVADLTVRCIFYIMFCSLRETNPNKTTQQLILEFYNELEELSLEYIFRVLFRQEVKHFLELSIKFGYSDIRELVDDIDEVLFRFFNECWYTNKIEDANNADLTKKGYKVAV